MTVPWRRTAGGGPGTGGRRLRLRSRVVLAFAVGAALVSASLVAITYGVAKHELVAQRTSSAVHQAFVNARLVKQELGASSTQLADVLSSLQGNGGSQSFIHRRGLWYGTSVSAPASYLPSALVASVDGGHVAEQRVMQGGQPAVVVGVPLPSIGIAYFEAHTLSEVQSTLGLLATILGLAALATTVGGGLVGLWASRRLVRPLTEVAQVAAEVAGGSLDRRVPYDPDLDPLVTSFNDMVGALQHRIERDARFASDVSHELRSPITTMRASVELLDAYVPDLPSEGQQAVGILGEEVDRFSSMVQDLLEIAQIDAGAANLQMTDIPLAELVRHALAARYADVPLTVTPAGAQVLVRGDKRRLQRIFANLLENADVHAGGAVGITVDRVGARAVVQVDDDGPGIDPAERGHLFERFYRGAASGRRGSTAGTGLGLSLVAEHAEAHGGTVCIEDRAGGGTRFTVSLPAEEG